MSSSKKGLKNLLILSVLAVVLFVYIAQIEVPAQESKEQGMLVFPKVATENIDSIAIRNQYGSFVLQRSDKVSQNRPPLELATIPGAMLNTQAVAELVSAIGQLSTNDKIDEPESDLTAYGLNPAATEVTVTVKGQESKKIVVGKENAFASKRYVKIGDDTNVYLLHDAFYSATDLKEEGFRERKPIRFESFNVKKIEIEGEGTLEQDDKGVWSASAPMPFKLDDAAVSKFLRSLKDAEVDTFLVAKETPKSFDKKLTLYYKDNSLVSLNFKIGADSVVGALSYEPFPFKFKKELGDNLKNIVESLRIKKPLSVVSVDEIQKLTVKQKTGESFSLIASTKEGSPDKVWQFENAEKNVDEAFFKQWVEDIKAVSVVGYLLSSKDAGLVTPSRSLTITNSKGEPIIVSIGSHSTKQEPAGYYASVSGYDGEIFILSQDAVKKLFPSLESLQKK
jgi:hypothetical protein